MTGFAAEWEAFVARHGAPERIELLLPDINAILRGKWLPGADAAKLGEGAVRLPLSSYAPNVLGETVAETGFGIAYGDPDGVLVPIEGTLKPVPWAEGPTAQVQCEMTTDGETVHPVSTRDKLAAIVARLYARGLRPVVATELEFYIIEPRAAAEDPPVPPPHAPAGAQNYELDVLDRTEALMSEIQAAAAAQDLETGALVAEFGPGQYEINFRHTEDVMAAADTAVLFRRLVRGVAVRHGLEATFMAKPYAEHTGNGMHVHVSLLTEDGGLFGAEEGVSEALAHAVAGTLATMAEMQAVFAPHLNSYRRFAPGAFSPNRPDWGFDHRGAAVRLPETRGAGARLEHRLAGADCNPYLALAAILGGVLEGLERGKAPPPPIDDPAATLPPVLPHDWRTAVEAFAGSDVAAGLFGEAFRDLYATVKRDEIAKLTTEITPLEYRTYLGRI